MDYKLQIYSRNVSEPLHFHLSQPSCFFQIDQFSGRVSTTVLPVGYGIYHIHVVARNSRKQVSALYRTFENLNIFWMFSALRRVAWNRRPKIQEYDFRWDSEDVTVTTSSGWFDIQNQGEFDERRDWNEENGMA